MVSKREIESPAATGYMNPVKVQQLAQSYMVAMEALSSLLYKAKDGAWFVVTHEPTIDAAAKILAEYSD